MNKKGVDYSLIMLFVVIVALSILYWRMAQASTISDEFIGDSQEKIMSLPYDKENIVQFVKATAELEMPEILKEVATGNGYAVEPPGGTYIDACTIINTEKELKFANKPDLLNSLTKSFNSHIDPYIKDYNAQSGTADIPPNNYELFIDGDNINAIALLPVAQAQTTNKGLVTMWFAPSFTINYPHKLGEYKKIFDILGLVVENCPKKADVMNCVETYKDSMTGWTWKQEGDLILFNVPSAHGTLCYAMKTPMATP